MGDLSYAAKGDKSTFNIIIKMLLEEGLKTLHVSVVVFYNKNP
jgi:hypothetical protein